MYRRVSKSFAFVGHPVQVWTCAALPLPARVGTTVSNAFLALPRFLGQGLLVQYSLLEGGVCLCAQRSDAELQTQVTLRVVNEL